jgi:hypothetical protein
MLDDESLDEAERWVDDWQQGVEARLARSRELAGRLRGVTGWARSGEGLVEVAVDSAGGLVNLYLDDGVQRHSARWIAAQILSTCRLARADAARQAQAVVQECGSGDTADGRALLAAFVDRLGEGQR